MIEYFKDTAGGWRYRIRARNGEVLCQSEAYTRGEDAKRGAGALVHSILSTPTGREQLAIAFDAGASAAATGSSKPIQNPWRDKDARKA